MVRAIEHLTADIGYGRQCADYLIEEVVGIQNTIIVGIAHLAHILARNGHIVIRQKYRHWARIALMVAKMGAIGMKYKEHLGCRVGSNSRAHGIHQLHIVTRSLKIYDVVGILGQMVYHCTLRLLGRDKIGCKARLIKHLRDTLATIQFIVLRGMNRREYHGYALMCCVTLCGDTSE